MPDTEPLATLLWRAQSVAGAGVLLVLVGYWALDDSLPWSLPWGTKTALIPFGVGIAFLISALYLISRIMKTRSNSNDSKLTSENKMKSISINLFFLGVCLILGHAIFAILSLIEIAPISFINFPFFLDFLLCTSLSLFSLLPIFENEHRIA